MKQQEFINLIESPSTANALDLQKLIELKKQFPFFQSAHMLVTLVSKKFDSSVYQQTLKQTAISIPNRIRLHQLLSAPITVTQEEKKEIEIVKKEEELVTTVEPSTELDHLKAIELSTEIESNKKENINDLVEKEIKRDVINAFIEKEVLKTNEWYKKDVKKKETKEEAEKTEVKEKLTEGSFTDWLQLLKKVDRVEEVRQETKTTESTSENLKTTETDNSEQQDKKAKQKAIIDKIIEVNPNKIRFDPNQRFYAVDVKAKESLIETEDLVTETLAKIYALQGNISKAIRAYEILSLKFPQKSAYFATLIQNLKKENK